MNILDSGDHEIAVLDNINRQAGAKPARQRDIARVVGISLGMTNVIIKKLAQKGWVKIRKVNNRNIRYAVTPAGMEEIARRSFQFLKKTVRNVVYYKTAVEGFLKDVARQGFRGVLLVGQSDFDFILAHLCQKQGLEFSQSNRDMPPEGWFALYGEDARPPRLPGASTKRSRRSYLQEILMRS